jgi:hypothetical protein
MTGRNPDGAEDFPSEVAHGPQRLNAIIGAHEDFRDRVRGTDDLRFHFVPVTARHRNPTSVQTSKPHRTG